MAVQEPPSGASALPAVQEASPLAELLVPIGGQLTLGSTLGYCSGVALRVAGRLAAFGIGGAFCLIQGLAYQGYIQVDWRRVERDYIGVLSTDEDGVVKSGDLARYFDKTVDVLTFNLPGATGFTAGLAYGLGFNSGTSLKAALLTGV